MFPPLLVLAAALALAATGQARAGDDLRTRDDWVHQHLESPGAPFFSFSHGGAPSADWLAGCRRTATSRPLDDRRTEHLVTWADPRSGLVLSARAVTYRDVPTVEWTLFFKNTASADSALLADVRPIDLALRRTGDGEFVLHHHTGDTCSAASYQPHADPLPPGTSRAFAPAGGRPTNGAYPYFNLAFDGGGLIACVAWPGQWSAAFTRDAAAGLRLAAGQERTRFKLHPGEQVRTPLIVLQFWSGDRIDAHNTWRRWMLAHNLPRPGGRLPEPLSSSCMGLHQDEAGEKAFIDSYVKGGAKLDYWWMDAGWYPCRDWPETGTWEPDPTRFPKGIRAVADHAHANGMKLVLWFEPERVHPGTWLDRTHPEWLLGRPGQDRLLNLGHPEARRWLTDHIDRFLTTQSVDLYRQDFNIDPLPFWRARDAEDRQGITEIRHVEGYLAFWDELLRRHPGLLIDSCASGGRRNDLETLRRSVPLLRSDFQAPQNPSDPAMLTGNQGHTYGLSFWVPYAGTGVFYDDVYAFRSHLSPALGIGYRPGEAVDWARMRRRFDDWRRTAHCFLGDYYPLTPYSLADKDWIAWQFHQPGPGTGLVQSFRRPRSPDEALTVRLRGLDPRGVYELQDLDRDGAARAGGGTLLKEGLTLRLPRRGAGLVTYRPLPGLAAVLAAPDLAETAEPVTFSARDSRSPGGNIAAYVWDFGDGGRGEGPSVTHTYTTPGVRSVCLTVRDGRGNQDTVSTTLTVRPPDTTPLTLVGAASGDPEKVLVTFSKPVAKAAAEDASHYALDRGAQVLAASLELGLNAVRLTTTPLQEGTTYTLSVRDLHDRARTPHALAAGARASFQTTGLYAWWKLDDERGDVALDSSGNGRHGTLAGPRGGPRWVSGPQGTALRFGGDGDLVTCDTHLSELKMPFSFSLWVNPAAAQVEYADIFGNHGEPFVGVSLQQDGRRSNVYGFGYGDGRRWQGVGPVALTAGQWQHVAIVCDGRTAIFCVNGEEKARAAAVGPVAANPGQDFKLGQGYHTGRFFRGQLRDVRIYRKALVPADVARLARG